MNIKTAIKELATRLNHHKTLVGIGHTTDNKIIIYLNKKDPQIQQITTNGWDNYPVHITITGNPKPLTTH